MSDALRPVVSQWIEKIKLAHDHKKREFQEDADEAVRFFDGPYDFLYSGWRDRASRGFAYGVGDEELPGPGCRMTVNKVAELVQLFGPALYHRNPVRKVNPRHPPPLPLALYGDPNNPQVQMLVQQQVQQQNAMGAEDMARAVLLEHYLNYTPEAMDLKTQSRWAIDEAIIKGMGVLWSEKYTPPGGLAMVGSFYDTVDNLYLDPDAETLEECKWIARRCVHPVWQVEQEYGLKRDSLATTGSMESYSRQAQVATDIDGDYRRKQGTSCDLMVYWKIWSKMGLGGRLTGVPSDWRDRLDGLGDFVYLVITEQLPYPLNLPPPLADMIGSEDPLARQQAQGMAQQKVQWPTPYWADDAWPFTQVVFHNRPRKIWPVSHIKPAMGELKFLNWAWSFLANKVRIASRDFLAIAKSAGEELKDRLKHGPDYTILEVEVLHGSIDKVVQFLQHPGFNPEIYKVIEGVTENFERRTGLTELMYGLSAKQLRSAQEANVKADAMNVRPDDMATKVEEAMTALSRKEAFAARWHLRGPDVERVFGQAGAAWWERLMVVSNPAVVLHQLEYRIEANSARKPNKSLDAENMKQAITNLFQPLFAYAQATGDTNPVNALIKDWAKSIDLDAAGYLLRPPPPPPPPGQGPPPGPPGKPGPGGPPPGPPPGPPNQGGPP